jgi:hypothetical protein
MLKRSPGAGRHNEVGEDKSIPLRVPRSLVVSIKALIKLHRGKVACPQIYAAIAMNSVYEVFDTKLSSLPIWGAESSTIKGYLDSLLLLLFKVYSLENKSSSLDLLIDELEAFIEKFEYTVYEVSVFRELANNLSLIEEIEKRVIKHYPLPVVNKTSR